MAELFDCADPAGRSAGLDAAAAAIGRGELVLLPTDTVYGVAADAFTPAAVTGLLAAKNRGRTMPVPVLIGEASTLAGLVVNLPPGQNSSASRWATGGRFTTSPASVEASPMSTGTGIVRPRFFAASSPVTAAGVKASAATP